METIFNFFIINPRHPLVQTFFGVAHKLTKAGYSVLIHDTDILTKLIEGLNEEFKFRVIVHMDFKGKNKLSEIPDCEGWREMKVLKGKFPNGQFVFMTRENEMFPSKGHVIGETQIYEGYTIHKGDEFTYDDFFKNIPINIKGELKFSTCLPPENAPLIGTVQNVQPISSNQNKEFFDVVIVCVTSTEFEALDLIFKINENEPYKIIEGNRFWKTLLKQKINSNDELHILLTMIGDEGNIPASEIVNLIFQNFNFNLITLVGIAAGNILKTSIYSTVLGNYIVYYENKKLVTSNTRNRNKPIPIDNNRGKDFAHIIGKHHANNWKKAFEEKMDSFKIESQEFDAIKSDWIKPTWFDDVNVEVGTILSGEKLFADGTTLLKLFKTSNIGKEALAGEMEGYGFAHTCASKRYNDWLVIRGISDYGGEEKSDPINQKYQKLAALSAITLLEYYLQNLYSPVNK